jgi:hypothetical protein
MSHNTKAHSRLLGQKWLVSFYRVCLTPDRERPCVALAQDEHLKT